MWTLGRRDEAVLFFVLGADSISNHLRCRMWNDCLFDHICQLHVIIKEETDPFVYHEESVSAESLIFVYAPRAVLLLTLLFMWHATNELSAIVANFHTAGNGRK